MVLRVVTGIVACFLVAACQDSSKPLGKDQRGGTIMGDRGSTDKPDAGNESEFVVPPTVSPSRRP